MFLAVLAARTELPTVRAPTDDAARDDSGPAPFSAQTVAAETFGRFYDRTKGALRAYLAAASRDAGLADDLTQEAFLRLYTAKREFADEEHRRRYLFRIASNLLIDHWRSRRHATLPLDDALLASPVRAAFQAPASDLDARHDIVRALAGLQARERQLVWLAHVEQLDHREISAIAGISSASVRVLLFRARRRLAAALDGTAAASGTKGVAR